jgi:predicted DNA-binding protein YlxM (UPF0122 family)
MWFEDTARMNLLYDFYGGLLKEKQQEIFCLYYADNLSLSEIAENMRISRQGVHDALRKAAAALEIYERELALLERFRAAEKVLGQARAELDRLAAERREDDGLAWRLAGLRAMIDRLDPQ